jgi:hypothetical protein
VAKNSFDVIKRKVASGANESGVKGDSEYGVQSGAESGEM